MIKRDTHFKCVPFAWRIKLLKSSTQLTIDNIKLLKRGAGSEWLINDQYTDVQFPISFSFGNPHNFVTYKEYISSLLVRVDQL